VKRLLTVFFVLALAVSLAPASHAKPRWHGHLFGPLTMRGGASGANTWPARKYYVYVPAKLAAARRRALVVFLHGTTQTAKDAAYGTRWNDLADVHGFVVAYPEESPDANNDGANAARAWPWGRAAYEGRDQGEFKTIALITRAVTKRYSVDARRVYIGGLSAGAIMGAAQAATYPDLYAAYGSWAGCAYLCADPTGALGYQRMGTHARVVPGILFSGTADYLVPLPLTSTQLTGWVFMNDWADDGTLNGSVSWTPTDGPTTVGDDTGSLEPAPNTGPSNGSHGDGGACLYLSHPKGNNPCPAGPLGWKSYPYTVTRYGFAKAPHRVVVESWYIHGMSHNYADGNTDGNFVDPFGPDTTTAAWRFFEAHPR